MRLCDLVQFHSPISGGVKRFIQDKCRYLEAVPDVEHRVIVPGPADGTERWGRSIVHTVRSPRLPGSASYRVLHDRRAIQRLVADFLPDVIEVGDPYLTAWIGRHIAHSQGARIVGFYHSDYPRAWHRTVQRFAGAPAGRAFERLVVRYLRRLYRGMDAMVVASERLRSVWCEAGLADRVRLVPLGVDVRAFHPGLPGGAAAIPPWNVQPGARVLLYVGRLAREKRIQWLVQCHAAMLAAGRNVDLVLVGDGEWRERVQRWTNANPRIHWLRYVASAPDLAAIYRAADVFVHAGLGETFGLSVLEAQACGLPVVTARHSGMDETVLPLPGNARVAAERETDWIQAIEAALAVPRTPADRAVRLEAVKARFTVERTFAGLVSLYRELLGGTSTLAPRAPAVAP